MLTSDEYEQAELELAIAQVRRGFKIHAAVYALVMSGLIVLNVLLIALTDANFPWLVFPLVGWGIGLTFHYVDAYRRPEAAVRARQETVEQYAKHRRAAA